MSRERVTSGSGRVRWRTWSVTLLGVLLIWCATGFTAYAVAWQTHKDQAQTVLLKQAHASIAKMVSHGHPTACVVGTPQPGQVSGILRVPALHLSAPVEEGTDDAELNVAVGHDPQSVWPGANGAAVFLAHDVSYFVHLNALEPGDAITYQTACNTVSYVVTGQQIVAAGSAVPNSSSPSLVLDTCYPPDALFFTSQRLLVRATEVSAVTKGAALSTSAALSTGAAAAPSYTTTVPPALMAQGLTLQQNEAPMGTMQLVNDSLAFAQSPGPLALEAAALEDYFGALHAGAQRQSAWWAAIAPGVAMPPQLFGSTVIGHDAPLNVEIDSTAGSPTQVVLRTTVTLAGGSAPGTYAQTVTLPVQGSVVTVGSWSYIPS